MKGFVSNEEEKNLSGNKNKKSDSTSKKTSRVIRIYGDKEWHWFTYTMDVYLDGQLIGKISSGKTMDVEIDYNNHCFEFHWNRVIGQPKKCMCFINTTFVGGIQIVVHRILDKISSEYTL